MSDAAPRPRNVDGIPHCSRDACPHYAPPTYDRTHHGMVVERIEGCNLGDWYAESVLDGEICAPAIRSMAAELVQLRAAKGAP
jgi:hypothetical protein